MLAPHWVLTFVVTMTYGKRNRFLIGSNLRPVDVAFLNLGQVNKQMTQDLMMLTMTSLLTVEVTECRVTQHLVSSV